MNELLLERSTCQETVEIGTEEFCDEVDIFERGDENVGKGNNVFMLNVFEEFQFSVSSLGEYRGAYRLRRL